MRPTFRSLVATLVAGLTMFTTALPAVGIAGFGDVTGVRYFAIPVQWMVNEGITTGTSTNCFGPQVVATRGQAVTFLWRAADRPSAPRGDFNDVTTRWMRAAVDWAEANGVTTGLSPGVFGPDHPITRAQFVTMLWRRSGSPSPATTVTYSDLVADWYRDAVAWATETGVTRGVGDGLFAPERLLTRGELATLLYRSSSPIAPRLDPSGRGCKEGLVPDLSWVGHVAAPLGVLGPLSSVAVDPVLVGVGWDGSSYVVPGGFSWDESVDGGYLLFDQGRVIVAGEGVSISGAVFDNVVSGSNAVVSAGAGVGAFVLRQFRIDGGQGSAAVGGSTGRGNGSVISNFEILGFDGDGIKPMTASTITDGYINVVSKPGSLKHYDGVQITGRSNVTLSRLRFRLEGTDNLNSAIFVHNNKNNGAVPQNTVITDIDVVYAPYSWFPLRIHGGSIVMRDVVGRGPKSADGQRPAALVQHSNQPGIDWTTIWSAFNSPVDTARN